MCVVCHAILVDGIAGGIVRLDEGSVLLAAVLVCKCLLADGQHSKVEISAPAVHEHGMLMEFCRRQLWLGEPYGINLVVEEHSQPYLDIVNLNTIDSILWLGTIYGESGQMVGCRETGHGNHLVGQLAELPDTHVSVADKLPVAVGRGHIPQLDPIVHKSLCPHLFGKCSLYPSSTKQGVEVEMGVAKPESHVYSLFLEEAILLGNEYRQAVHRWRSAYLECQRVEPSLFCPLPAGNGLLLAVGIIAGGKHACEGKQYINRYKLPERFSHVYLMIFVQK